jgi:UTP--glucose-1-phosphate uridylyltransferase
MPNQHPAHFLPFEEKMRREGLPDIAIDNFHYYYDVLAAGSAGLIPESDIDPVASAPGVADVARYAEAGRAALDRVAVLKLNGGLGTSMGLDQAKSLLIARDGLTFLDIIARHTLSFRERFGASVPLILMNSFNTDADSRAVLERYPALAGPIPLALLQNKVPKIRADTLQPVEWPADPHLEWCPPGHGEVYVALAISGLLETLLDNGYEHLFMSNVDNLGATLDLGILGYVAAENIPFLMEVADRTPADKKGGHIARLHDDQLILREIAQCPEADLPAFQDIGKHKFFNTNNIWVNLQQLAAIMAANHNVLKLPLIRNAKTVDPKDPDSPRVLQLETAMGSAIGVFPGAQVLRVERDRFMPVKTCEDLLRLRSDAYVLDDTCRIRAVGTGVPVAIELDPRYYKRIDDFEARIPQGPPSLRECARLEVRGDVVFEREVVCKGSVRLVNSADEQRRLAAGAVVADTTLDLTDA